MLKRFLIAIRKPIILSSGAVWLENSEYIKEEERLTNILMRRVVILRIKGSEAVAPLDGIYKRITTTNSSTQGFYKSSVRRHSFIPPVNSGTVCKCDKCSRVELVVGDYRGRNCSVCGGILIPIEEVKQ